MEDSQTAAVALRRAATRLALRLRAERSVDGPSGAGLGLLGQLYRHGAMTASQLATAERVQPQSLTRTLAALEEQGLIERAPDPDDRRRQIIEFTDEGRDVLTSHMQESDDWLAGALDRLNPTERGVLRLATDLLDDLLDGDLARP